MVIADKGIGGRGIFSIPHWAKFFENTHQEILRKDAIFSRKSEENVKIYVNLTGFSINYA